MLEMRLTDSGIDRLKYDVEKTLKYARLYNDDEFKLEVPISNIYRDENGIITAEFEIPANTMIDTPVNKLVIVDEGRTEISSAYLPNIFYIGGIAGKHVIKYDLEELVGEANEIIFKDNDYLTKEELTEDYLKDLIVQALSEKDKTYFLKPDFVTDWVTVKKGDAPRFTHDLGFDAYFNGYIKLPNGHVIQFGSFSMYMDNDVESSVSYQNTRRSGFYLINTGNEIIVPTIIENARGLSDYIFALADGISYTEDPVVSVEVKIIGWKLPDYPVTG